jgi:alkylated DNA repair dioxygenase AlkB
MKRKRDTEQKEKTKLVKKRKLNIIPNETNKRIYLTEDKLSWIDQFMLPKDLHLDQKEYDSLWETHPEEFDQLKIYGKLIQTPRWTQVYGKSYKFSGVVHKSNPFSLQIQKILDYVNGLEYKEDYNTDFNTCVVNWYKDGSHCINYHADNESSIIRNKDDHSVIVSISFGQEREFHLKNNKTNDVTTILLKSNSVVIMGGETQLTHKHAINRTKKIIGSRINLTFRMNK